MHIDWVALVRVGSRPVPGFAVKGPIIFMPWPIHHVEEAAELVPEQQEPVGIVIEQLAELLDGRVVDEVPLRRRRRVPRRGLEVLPQILRRPIVLQRRPKTPGQVLAPRLGLGQAKLMGEHPLLVPGVGVGDQPTQRAERGPGSS